MRRAIALCIIVASITLFQSCSRTPKEPFDQERAESLTWDERYHEAVAYIKPYADQADHEDAQQSLCLAYGLWGKGAETLESCAKSISHVYYAETAACAQKLMRGEGTKESLDDCRRDHGHSPFSLAKAFTALVHYRRGELTDAQINITLATTFVLLHHSDFWAAFPGRWIPAMISLLIYTPPAQQLDKFARFHDFNEPNIKQMRVILLYGSAANMFSRNWRGFRMFYAEHPYSKLLLFGSTGFLIFAGALILGRNHLRSPAQKVGAWLRSDTRATGQAAPAFPSPYPSYWQAGYMNRAYQIAAYCWGTAWFLLAIPLVLLLAIPAVTILLDFSTKGMQSGIANARGFATGFLGWGRLWFALLLLSLTVFAVTKIYGRYSLPKPFRPRIRVIRTTIRLALLTVVLISVTTLLSYFSGVALNLYNNPMIKLLIDFLRKTLGL